MLHVFRFSCASTIKFASLLLLHLKQIHTGPISLFGPRKWRLPASKTIIVDLLNSNICYNIDIFS